MLFSILEQQEPKKIINDIVDMAMALGDGRCDDLIDNFNLNSLRKHLTDTYCKYILEMENVETEKLLAEEKWNYTDFIDIAGEAALMAYNRVSDIFDIVNFDNCQQFVLIGCGQLPITAIHVMDKTTVPEIYCLDISEDAVAAVMKMKEKYGWSRLHPLACNGLDFDFRDADIVYITNMVSPKYQILDHVIKTASTGIEIILREPYSLGRLWAEKAESSFAEYLNVRHRGRGSRYLSRDVFINIGADKGYY